MTPKERAVVSIQNESETDSSLSMMRTVMQQALEALEELFHSNSTKVAVEKYNTAYNALREVFEQPNEIDWIETNKALAKEIIEMKKQAEQEPVAWLEINPQGEHHALYMEYGDGHTKEDIKSGWKLVPLYTTPPPVEAAVLAEREACAKVCESFKAKMDAGIEHIAAAIRARGEK